jgi:acetamidase/formamidase
MTSVVRLAVDRSRHVVEPEIATGDTYAVTAFGESLDEAAAKATAYLHRRLVDTGHMSATDAYVLMSLAGRLVVNQVVDVPHVGVRFELPRTVLDLT